MVHAGRVGDGRAADGCAVRDDGSVSSSSSEVASSVPSVCTTTASSSSASAPRAAAGARSGVAARNVRAPLVDAELALVARVDAAPPWSRADGRARALLVDDGAAVALAAGLRVSVECERELLVVSRVGTDMAVTSSTIVGSSSPEPSLLEAGLKQSGMGA
jgi:hypothetical protein